MIPDSQNSFLQKYPKLYHVSQSPSLATIQRHGVLSTSAILDLLGVVGDIRIELEQRRRPESVPLQHPVHGSFILNDQSPLNQVGLEQCLIDMTATDWIAELNRRVFLFPKLPAEGTLATAVRARKRPKFVLEYNTIDILQLGDHAISFASINSGYTMRKPTPRGSMTFQPLSGYDRKPKPNVAEVCVLGQIPATIPFKVLS